MMVEVEVFDRDGSSRTYTMPDDEISMFVSAQDTQLHTKLILRAPNKSDLVMEFNGFGWVTKETSVQ